MERLRKSFEWAESHPKVWLDVVRIYLGIGLFIRGLLIITNSSADFVEVMLEHTGRSWLLSAALMHYVSLAHFVGGILITVGLLTRIAAAAQIPVVAGALLLVHSNEGLMTAGQSLEFSALVLFLLVVIAAAGAGPLSIDGDKARVVHPLELDPATPAARMH